VSKKNSSKAIRIVLPIVLVVILLLVGGGYAWFYNLTRSPLPQHDGEINVSGLTGKVEIIRDSYGIPHIYANTQHDLFFAQGYTQAQDRWWQMEFFRHTASGRIEELVGKNESLISADIFLKTLGWHRIAEEEAKTLEPEYMSHLQAFSDGVNAYITSRNPEKLSLTYAILKLTGVKPKVKPWTPADTLAFAKLMAWDLGYRDAKDELRAILYDILGQEMTDQWLTPPWPFGQKPTIVQPEDLALPAAKAKSSARLEAPTLAQSTNQQQLSQTIVPICLAQNDSDGIGSNNWIVSGKLTQTGAPLLANDIHLGIQMPSIWYEIGLHCPPEGSYPAFDAVGFAFAAAPGIIIGHNNNIAWAVTNVFPDVHDLYQMKVNPNNPLQYEWNGNWRDMVMHEEVINFGDGKPPIIVKVRQTHLGPIINDNKVDKTTGEVLGFNDKDPLALRWTALEPSTLIKAVIGIDKAANYNDFRNALKYWDVPSQNIIYADTKGNIGYQLPGKIPIRSANHSGLLPMPGWTGEFEWKGYIPFENLPRIFNPNRGYVVTANQAIVPLEYYDLLAQQLGLGKNYTISQEWNYGYRAQRIVQLINEKAPHSIVTFQAIQGDNKMLSAEEVLPYLAALKYNDPELAAVRDWLVKWDGQCHKDSPQAALYAEFWMSLMNNLYKDQLGEKAQIQGNSKDMWATFLLLQQPNNKWWDNSKTKDMEDRDAILSRSFREGYANTIAALGKDRNKWKWGNLHTATFVNNPLGASGLGPVEDLVNRGPIAVNGSTGTVNNTWWSVSAGGYETRWIPSMRMIIDLGDFSRSVCINSTGQSGHPYSKHYGDMMELWRDIRYHPMLWTQAQVEAAAANRLVLNPAK
jgi:penicillin amidase